MSGVNPRSKGMRPSGVGHHALTPVLLAVVATSPASVVLLVWPVIIVGIRARCHLASSPNGVAGVTVGAEALLDGHLYRFPGGALVP